MAQNDMSIANQGFPAFRADLNSALAALVSNSSGATAPSAPFAHQFWVDTSVSPNILKMRNADNDAWVTLGSVDQVNDRFVFLGTSTDTAALPSFSFNGDPNTGIFTPGADQLGLTTGGAVRLTVTTAQFTGTLPWRGQNGTAAAPALSASGDTNTGIFFPAADAIGFAEGGVEAMRITSDGDVGVGTTTPAQKLHVNGAIKASMVVTESSMGFRNRIINGDMRIDQRNAGASVTPAASGVFLTDRWQTQISQASKLAFQQNRGAVTPPVGFTNYLGVATASAVSIGAADFFTLIQTVEGFNVADLGWGTANAQAVTLSFRVYSSLTGTFGGSIYNSAFNRSYPFTYSVASANTWTTVTVNIAGDTSGTWVTNNGIGLGVSFGLGAGSTYSGTAGAWAGSGLFSATGATSVVGTSGATFYITGVQLEVGSVATPFERRPFGTELALCQRYYYRLKSEATGTRMGSLFCDSTTVATALVSFPTSMRTRPLSLEQSGTAADYTVIAGAANPACSSVPAFGISTIDCASVNLTVASGLTTGFGGQIRAANANAFLAWSVEL